MRNFMRLTGFFVAGCFVGILLWSVATVSAQNTGQICVRSFDDRNANGIYDPGDPPITRGVSASLLDADNVIIRTLLLEDSPQAAQGIMCFQQLEAGQYTVQVASADYDATTTDTFVTAVTTTSIPQVFDFGAQVYVFELPEADVAPQPDLREVLARVLFSSLGALIGMGGMVVLGSLLYFFFLRPKPSPAQKFATGAYPAPMPTAVSTDEHRAVRQTGAYASAGGYVSSATPPPSAPVTPPKSQRVVTPSPSEPVTPPGSQPVKPSSKTSETPLSALADWDDEEQFKSPRKRPPIPPDPNEGDTVLGQIDDDEDFSKPIPPDRPTDN